MQTWVIDFETRSALSVKDVGPWIYARHESTTPLCLSFAPLGATGRPEVWSFKESSDILAPLFEAIRAGALIEAHNVAFERCIWSLVCVPRLFWPPIAWERWRCTSSRAVAVGLPRALDDAAKVARLDVRKDLKGKRVMQKLSKPRKATKADTKGARPLFDEAGVSGYLWHEKPDELATLFEYCATDVEVEKALSAVLPELSPKELALWDLDQRINERGLAVDLDLVRAAIKLLDVAKHKADELCLELTGGAVSSLSQNRALVAWLKARGYPYDSLAEEVVAGALKLKSLSPEVKRVLELQRSVAQSSTAKYKKLLSRTDVDGRTRDTLVYCGAIRTGRWSGTGVQFQNLPRGAFNKFLGLLVDSIKFGDPDLVELYWGSIHSACASAIRSAIIAPAGYRLIVCDFAAIEARVLAWLADEPFALGLFASDVDIYKAFAVKLYGLESADEVTKDQRQISKICILGLGYQMGPAKFRDTCEAFGAKVSDEFAHLCVTTFREEFIAYPAYWRRLERAAIAAVENPKSAFTVDRLRFYKTKGALRIELPSGRCLSYLRPSVRVEHSPWGERPKLFYEGMNQQSRKWGIETTYGGKLAENVTQAVARDLMAESMIELERLGYRNVLTIHDEAVLEAPIGFGSLAEVIDVMKSPPDWAIGCPIGAAGFEADRYRKD